MAGAYGGSGEDREDSQRSNGATRTNEEYSSVQVVLGKISSGTAL